MSGFAQHSPLRWSVGLLWQCPVYRQLRVNPFICHIMNLLWLLSDRGTRVRFCQTPNHYGIEGNERVDQVAKETLDRLCINPLASLHYRLKPLFNSYIQQLVQTKWDVAMHGRDLCLVKPGTTIEIPALNQSWRVCDHPTSNWPPSVISCPDDHQLLVNTVVKHWALTICSWIVQYYRNVVTNTTQLTHWIPSWDNSRDLHSGIPTRSGILLSDMNGQIFYAINHMNHPGSDVIC